MSKKEPFDLRLTVLRMIRNLHIIAGVTLAGVLLFGGGYYVKNVMMNSNTTYETTSTYRVSYVEEPSKAGDYVINEMTWNTYVDSKEFQDAVWAHLSPMVEIMMIADPDIADIFNLENKIDVRLESDVHVPITVVKAESEELALLLAGAVEQAMMQEFVETNEQIGKIEVITPALEAWEVVPDVRPLRAVILSGILSCFFAVIFLLLKEISDNAIWLPATLRKRYGLKALGTVNSPDFWTNMDFVMGDRKAIAVCAVDDEVNPMEVIRVLTERQNREWIPVPAPMLCPESSKVMREADGVLLVVKSGKNAEKTVEYVMEYLETQEIQVTGALLWDADEWLIRMYYGKVMV